MKRNGEDYCNGGKVIVFEAKKKGQG